jgi:hypothetical protein
MLFGVLFTGGLSLLREYPQHSGFNRLNPKPTQRPKCAHQAGNVLPQHGKKNQEKLKKENAVLRCPSSAQFARPGRFPALSGGT